MGLFFSGKEVREVLPQPGSLRQDRFEGHRQLSSYIKQEILAESTTHERVWETFSLSKISQRSFEALLFHPNGKWRQETDT